MTTPLVKRSVPLCVNTVEKVRLPERNARLARIDHTSERAYSEFDQALIGTTCNADYHTTYNGADFWTHRDAIRVMPTGEVVLPRW